jgi:tRNA(fMet)-specific endonuclease VapC
MSGRCLLDTNIVIALFANETAVKENLANTEEVFIPMDWSVNDAIQRHYHH